MNIARNSIEKPLFTWIFILSCLIGGVWGFLSLGQLEDPAFTIKTAAVVTQYTGASAEQVANEVTEPLESAIQKMAEVDKIISVNTPGQSLIEVEIKPTVQGSELPQVCAPQSQNIRCSNDTASRRINAIRQRQLR